MPHKRAKKSVREQERKGRGADLAPPGADNSGNGMGISNERIPKSAARVLDAARIRAEYKQKKRVQMQMEGLTTKAKANDDHDYGRTCTGGTPKSQTQLPPHKKRRTVTDAGAGAEKSRELSMTKPMIEIQPGESLYHFNRRVEDHMRPLVQSAMRASAATERKERKAATPSSSTATTTTKSKASVNDTSSTTVRRDNDDDNDHDHDHRPKEFAVVSSAAQRRLNDIAMAPPELKKLPRGVKTTKHNSSAAGAGAGAGVLSMAQRVMMERERERAIKRYREMKERKTKEADRTLLTVTGPGRIS